MLTLVDWSRIPHCRFTDLTVWEERGQGDFCVASKSANRVGYNNLLAVPYKRDCYYLCSMELPGARSTVWIGRCLPSIYRKRQMASQCFKQTLISYIHDNNYILSSLLTDYGNILFIHGGVDIRPCRS